MDGGYAKKHMCGAERLLRYRKHGKRRMNQLRGKGGGTKGDLKMWSGYKTAQGRCRTTLKYFWGEKSGEKQEEKKGTGQRRTKKRLIPRSETRGKKASA